MATSSAQQSSAPNMRSWNPSFVHSDRERWVCVYPAYINSKKTLAEGRKIAKSKAIDNPTYTEIRDVCANAGLTLGVENKVYCRERDTKDVKFRGRIRVQLKNDDGTLMLEQFPTRKALLEYIGETIPKLKTRSQGQSSSSSQSQQSGGASGGGGGGKKSKGKKK